MNILTSVKRWWRSLFSITDIEEALGVKVLVSPELQRIQQQARDIYDGNAEWNTDKIKSLKLAKAMCEKVATLWTLELEGEITGNANADYVNEQLQPVIKVDGADGFRVTCEMSLYGGNIVFKPFPDEKSQRIITRVVENGFYFPIRVDSENQLVESAFSETIVKDDDTFYTLLEHANYDGEYYHLAYTAYVSNDEGTLGKPIPLTRVEEWAHLPETISILTSVPWFAVFTVPMLGKTGEMSPAGFPLFYDKFSQLEEADRIEEMIRHEYAKSRLKQQIPSNMLLPDGAGGYTFPDGRPIDKDEYVIVGATTRRDGSEETGILTYNPTHRIDTYEKRMNGILRQLEAPKFSYGTFSDLNMVARTATEVQYGRTETANTVTSLQNAMTETLKHLTQIIAEMSAFYGFAPKGEVELDLFWDDSIVQTSEEKRKEFTDELRDVYLALENRGVIDKTIVYAFALQHSETLGIIPEEIIKEAEKALLQQQERKKLIQDGDDDDAQDDGDSSDGVGTVEPV